MSIKAEAILTTIDAVSNVTSIVSNIHDLRNKWEFSVI